MVSKSVKILLFPVDNPWITSKDWEIEVDEAQLDDDEMDHPQSSSAIDVVLFRGHLSAWKRAPIICPSAELIEMESHHPSEWC
ncbi:hypothetical protein CEXT_177921 [Caerostris extrusa]|uniref:Uncharacterized protein n=1 Tax=Caerostris extrusa TaxID=172846 RepID=A0AAV4W7S6_CAEEX|nr:hypothetical protein CEXT_177921 [Caerostris extrusa]